MDERDGQVVGHLSNASVCRAKLRIDKELYDLNAQFDLLVQQIETLHKIVANQRETINMLNGFEEADEQSKEL